jgi:competence protein ComEC
MRQPLVWIAAALAGGIIALGPRAVWPEVWAVLAIAAILAGLACVGRRWLWSAWGCALAAWLLVGGLAAELERIALPANQVARFLKEHPIDTSVPLRWSGRLRSDPVRLPWGLRYEIDLEGVEVAGELVPVVGGLRLSYFDAPRASETPAALRAGDHVEALVAAHPPRNFLDPGAFDFRSYLARQDIHLTGTLRSAELLRKVGSPPLGLRYRLAQLRGRLLDRVDALFAPREAAVLRAMLLGDRSFVDSEMVESFQKSAAYHVLVLAGLHVGALAAFFFWLGRRLRLPLSLTVLATLLGLGLYVAVVDDRPPILRAALMALAALCALLFFRRSELLNAVALAALVLLVLRPSNLTDPSFQLSFLAAGVIAALGVPWMERTAEPYRDAAAHLDDVTRDALYPPRVAQFRLDLRAAAGWLAERPLARGRERATSLIAALSSAGSRLAEVVILSVVIQLGLLPLLAFYFHRVSLSGPVANVPAVLLTGLIVPLGFLTLAASFLWMWLGVVLSKFLSVLVQALVASLEWFGRWHWSSYRIPGPPGWLLGAFFGVLVLMAMALRTQKRDQPLRPRGRRWILAALLAAVILPVAMYPFPPRLHKSKLEVTVLDVGQGDSLFAAFPDGHTMLIDGGGQAGTTRVGGYRTGVDIGEAVVSPYLWSRGLKRLDVVALTHAHHDHLDGLNAVLENFRVRELWVGRDVASPAYENLLEIARAHGVAIVHRLRGSSFGWGGVTAAVLWPEDPSEAAEASNNDSLVVRMQYGGVAYLLPGDIEQKVESRLTAEGDPLGAQFLKVPHHGSRTSSTPEFLARIAPGVAVISVGQGNAFGQPHLAVLERFHEAGVHLYRTDQDGAASALTDGRSVEVHAYAESSSR